MKTTHLFFVVAVIMFLAACSKSKSATITLKDIFTLGTWHVHHFIEDNIDKTSNYDGFVFTFNPNGSLMVVKNGITYTGTWTEDDSHTEFTLNISTGDSYLLKLNEDWLVTGRSDSFVEFKNSNPSKNEIFHLEKL